LRDGWDLARDLRDGSLRDGANPSHDSRNGADLMREPNPGLPALAEAELAAREAEWRYDGTSAPRRRRGPAVRRVGRAVAVQVAGRVRVRVGRS
jgi:hypothetical protein